MVIVVILILGHLIISCEIIVITNLSVSLKQNNDYKITTKSEITKVTKLPYKSVKLKLGFTSIFFKFWHNVCCVASYSMLVGSYAFFDYQSFYRDSILTYHDSLQSLKNY